MTPELNFQLTVDSIPGMVHTMTATGQVEFVNRQILEFFGKTLEELNDWARLVHPDDRSRVGDAWTRAVATGEPFDSEHRVLDAGGTYRWLHARGLPLRDSSGTIVRWYNLLTDVDERKRAEEALRESERESRLIVDNIPGLVALLAETGEVEVVNRQLLDYFGQTLEELRQWGTNGTVHPEDVAHVADVFLRSITTGSPYQIVQRFRRSDGVYRWFENSGYPLRDPQGRITRWCVLLTDIDERKRAEDALKNSERSLQLIIDTIPALAWAARPDGTAEFFNQHYLDFMGLTAEQAGGWGWTTAVHPEDLNERGGCVAAHHGVGFARRGGSPTAPRRRRISLVSVPCQSAARRRGTHRQVVRHQHRHRRPQASRGGASASLRQFRRGPAVEQDRQLHHRSGWG